jgi:hypothetical protein
MRSREDMALETAARTGWAMHELPARHVTRTDSEAADAAAALAGRLLTRRAIGTCERHPDGHPHVIRPGGRVTRRRDCDPEPASPVS